MNSSKFNEFRNSFPHFTYDKYSWSWVDEGIRIKYNFNIDGLSEFAPTMFIPLPENSAKKRISHALDDRIVDRLVFLLGMVELVSYWKLTCSPTVMIKAGKLNEAEIEFWLDLYYGGLGEFFYINNSAPTRSDFMHIEVQEIRENLPFAWTLDDYNAFTYEALIDAKTVLVPIGGGKDSVVSLEFLKKAGYLPHGFGINSTGAAVNTMQIAELSVNTVVERKLDCRLIELNKQGFLNGHTPFSAIVAFTSLLTAYLYNIKDIALSNENSADEVSVKGTSINHQYSKSSLFEKAMQDYIKSQIGLSQRYFSLLRPLSELAIAYHFAGMTAYHADFRSCNVGSKKNIWCGRCAKCLFVAIILLPFLGEKEVEKIIGRDIFAARELLPVLRELLGLTASKPFECVGQVAEVGLALALATRRKERPFLLKSFIDFVINGELEEAGLSYNSAADRVDFPPKILEKLLGQYKFASGLPKEYQDILPTTYPVIEELNDQYFKAFPWEKEGKSVSFIKDENLKLITEKDSFEEKIPDLIAKHIKWHANHLILGFGREGKSMLNFLLANKPVDFKGGITIADAAPIQEATLAELTDKICDSGKSSQISRQSVTKLPIKLVTGADYLSALAEADICYKSPGISFKNLDLLPRQSSAQKSVREEVLDAGDETGADVESGVATVENTYGDTDCNAKKNSHYGSLNCQITCQVDLFLAALAGQIVGITGTKGKSTTTSLIHSVLNQKTEAWLLGNIGRAPFTALNDIALTDEIALELSCHQLQYSKHSPHIAVMTNIYPEHLDHYRDFAEYFSAKLNIFRWQTADDWAILPLEQAHLIYEQLPEMPGRVILFGAENQVTESTLADCQAKFGGWRVYGISAYSKPAQDKVNCSFRGEVFREVNPAIFAQMPASQIKLTDIIPSLRGMAHAADLTMAVTVAILKKLSYEQIIKGVRMFAGLPHRCEYVGEFKGIKFFNDSISTIPETCIVACKTLPNVQALIVGGMDRGIDYEPLCRFIAQSELQILLCLPDTGRIVADGLRKILVGEDLFKIGEKSIEIIELNTIDEAVTTVYSKLAGRGGVCLFSPAAASYHLFKDFAERGNKFKEIVKKQGNII